MNKWCDCGKKIPNKDTYCEKCNILFYNLNKLKSSIRIKEKKNMIDETQTEEKEEEVSEEAEKATEETN